MISIDSGRFKDLCGKEDQDGLAAQMQGEMQHCEYGIKIGPLKTMVWGVPDSTRDASGNLIHDDTC